MDIISYGLASKIAKQEKDTRENVLATGVEGSHPHVRERIDKLEEGVQGVVAQTDQLAVQDAVNIMKANAKLNAIAKTTKYKMHNMIFDDLLDLSGIDTPQSSGYAHDAATGEMTAAAAGGIIVTKAETAAAIPTKAILSVEESGSGVYHLSRDNGVTWEEITPDTLFYFHDRISPPGKDLRLKAELPSGTKLLNYALTWA